MSAICLSTMPATAAVVEYLKGAAKLPDDSQARLACDEGLLFSVVELDTVFHRPARLDDELVVRSAVGLSGRASVLFTHEARLGTAEGELIASGRVKVACIGAASFRPRRLPDWLLERLD